MNIISANITGSLILNGVDITDITGSQSNIESLNSKTGSYATTGSNIFNGDQNISGSVVITGSLTTTGTITAQKLNVQQVTSSVVYSSGSNVFGNNLSNTQVMTGSVNITGSLNVTGILNGTSGVFTSTITSNVSSGIFFNNSSGGTNSTQIKLNNTGGDLRIGVESSTGATIQLGTLPYAAVFGNQSNNSTQFTTNGTTRMTITSDGNVGIGTIPKGIGTTQTLEIGRRGAIYDNNDNFAIVNNGWNDGTWKYKETGFATILSTASGVYTFNNSASGTQNSPITFIERMRIAADGKVGIGTTAPNTTLEVGGTIGSAISTLSYQYHGKKILIGGPTTTFVINVVSEFPQVLLNVSNAWGFIGRCVFLGVSGHVEVREFYIGRRGGLGAWSSANYGPTSNTTTLFQSVTASDSNITINMNTDTYVTVELTAMIR